MKNDIKPEDIRKAEKDLSKVRDKLGSLDHLGKEKIERMRQSRIKIEAKKRNKELLRKANNIDHLITETIDLFTAGSFVAGAEAVAEIAHLWKTGGQSVQSYCDLMKFIEDEAIKKSGVGELLRLRIRDALQAYSAKKRGSSIIH